MFIFPSIMCGAEYMLRKYEISDDCGVLGSLEKWRCTLR